MNRKEKLIVSQKVQFPKGWKIERLESLSEDGINNGTFFDPKKTGTGYRHINIDQMYIGPQISTNGLRLLNVDNATFEKKQAKFGDVFFTRSSLVWDGIAYCNVLLDHSQDFTFDDHLMRVRPRKDIINPKYLNEYCRTFHSRRFFLTRAKRSTMTTIAQGDIGDLLVGFPSMKEQEKIAKILSTWDEAIEKQEIYLQNRKLFLSQQVESIYSQIKKTGKETTLRNVCLQIQDGTHSTPDYTSDGVPFYSVETLVSNDFKNTKYISKRDHEINSKRCRPQKGDLLFTRIGSLGVSKLIDWDIDASIYVSLALLKPDNKLVESEFLYFYFQTKEFNRELLKRSLLNAAPQKINLSEIGNIPIFLPKEGTTQKITGKYVMAIKSELKLLEMKIENLKIQKQGLMQKLLTGKKRVKV